MENRYEKIATGEGSLLSQVVDEELVIYQYDGDAVHRLNATGRVVWDCLDHLPTRPGLAEMVAESFGRPVEDIREDVDTLLDDLLEEGLVSVVEAAGGAARVERAPATRRAFLRRGLKGAAVVAYAVPMIQTFGITEAHAQPPSQITNEPPPPTADPVITSISPTSQQINTKKNINKTINVYGYDFVDTPTASFSPSSGILVRSVRYRNPNQVNVRIRIYKTASPGARTLTITNPNTEYDTYCCYTLT